jgi:hypothetical protein
MKEHIMKKKNNKIEADDLAIYEPVNSKFREQMFMKWRMEDKGYEHCEINCKSRTRKHTARKRQQFLQPWL